MYGSLSTFGYSEVRKGLFHQALLFDLDIKIAGIFQRSFWLHVTKIKIYNRNVLCITNQTRVDT